jgi:hypothetical protein
MTMMFEQFEFERRDDLQQRPRQLTQSSTHCGDDTALANFAPANESSRFSGRTQLFPKTEYFSGKQHSVLQLPASKTQVSYLSFEKRSLPAIGGSDQWRDGFHQDERKVLLISLRQNRQITPSILEHAPRLMDSRFHSEEANRQQARMSCHGSSLPGAPPRRAKRIFSMYDLIM